MAKRFNKKKAAPVADSSAAPIAKTFGSGLVSPMPAYFAWKPLLGAVMIFVAAGVIFWPVLHGDWLWDDNVDITQNPVTQAWNGLWGIWFQPGVLPDYYPVKDTVQWAQWQFFGNDTFGYHITNVVLHGVSGLLLWCLLARMGLRFAWLGGMLFVVHPALVESVAWIAELKNTLSMPLFLLASIFYVDYDAQRRSWDYRLSSGFFLLAMLTKPAMVMFPVVILLYAWWKRGRVERADLTASAPFFIVSLVLGFLTIFMASWFNQLQHQDAASIPVGGLFSRLELIGLSLDFYFYKSICPVTLLPVYPQWVVEPPSWTQFWPWPVLVIVLVGLWSRRSTWGRTALFGLLFFLVMLVPFSGLILANYMSFSWVMDHFLYIPILGLIGLGVAGIDLADTKISSPVRYGGIGLLAIILVTMILESRSYAKKYVSEEVLWTYTLSRDPTCWFACKNLGNILLQQGRTDEGIALCRKALEIHPNLADAYFDLALGSVQKGQWDEAIALYQKTLEINPRLARAHFDFGLVLGQTGRVDEAVVQYQKALEINPDFDVAHDRLGNIFLQKGRLNEAIVQYQKALDINPDLADAHYNLGLVLAQQGHLDAAIFHFQEAVRLNPGDANVQKTLARAQALEGQDHGSK